MERTQTPTNKSPLLVLSSIIRSEIIHLRSSLDLVYYPMVQCSMPAHHKRVWCTWFSKVWIKSDREGCGAFIKISLQSIRIKSLSITIFHQDNYGHYCFQHQLHGKLDPTLLHARKLCALWCQAKFRCFHVNLLILSAVVQNEFRKCFLLSRKTKTENFLLVIILLNCKKFAILMDANFPTPLLSIINTLLLELLKLINSSWTRLGMVGMLHSLFTRLTLLKSTTGL